MKESELATRATPQTGPSLGRRAASGAAWLTLELFCAQGMSLVVFSVMAHFLSPRDFGLVSITFVFIYSVKSIFLDQICSAITRKAAATDLEYTTAFWFTLGVSLVACAALLIFSRLSDRLFKSPGLGDVMQAMSVILLIMGGTRAQEAWLIRNFRFQTLALRTIIGVVIGGAAGITFAVLHFGVWALVIQQVVTSLAAFALLYTTCPWRPTFAFSVAAAKEIARILCGAGSGNAISVLNDNCDTLLIALAFGSESAGIYAVGKRLMLALQMVAAQPVIGVAMPILAEVQNDDARLRQMLLTAIQLVLTSCGAIFFGTAAIGHDAIVLLFGEKWQAAGPVLSWLAIGGLCSILIKFNNVMFLIRGRAVWIVYLAGLYSILSLVCFLALKVAGLRELALPFVLPWMVVLLVSAGLLTLVTSLSVVDWLRAVVPPLTAAAIMFASLQLITPRLQSLPLRWRIGVAVAAGALIYVTAMAVISRRALVGAINIARPAIRRRFAASPRPAA